jgi:hypothetical protein
VKPYADAQGRPRAKREIEAGKTSKEVQQDIIGPRDVNFSVSAEVFSNSALGAGSNDQ